VDQFGSKLSNKNEEIGNKSTYLKRGGEKFLLQPPIPSPTQPEATVSGTPSVNPVQFDVLAIDAEDEVVGAGGLDADFSHVAATNETHEHTPTLPSSTTSSTNSNPTTVPSISATAATTADVIPTNFTRLNKNDTIFVRNSQNITTLKLKNLQNKE
jgi:hypothetical protein